MGKKQRGKVTSIIILFLNTLHSFSAGTEREYCLIEHFSRFQILGGSYRHRGWRDMGGTISNPDEGLSALFYFSQEFGYFSLHRASGLLFCCLGSLPKVPFMHACLVKKFMVQLGRQQG